MSEQSWRWERALKKYVCKVHTDLTRWVLTGAPPPPTCLLTHSCFSHTWPCGYQSSSHRKSVLQLFCHCPHRHGSQGGGAWIDHWDQMCIQAPVLSHRNPFPQMCSAPPCGRAMTALHGDLDFCWKDVTLYFCSFCLTSDTITIFTKGAGGGYKSPKQLIPERRMGWRSRAHPFSLGVSICLPSLLCEDHRLFSADYNTCQ